jgi:diguanylate cyclase (GGDEF)-like protein
MKNLFKKMYSYTAQALYSLYRVARGIDYRLLHYYIMKMNQEQNIDSIMYQLARCLHQILQYRSFAIAIYDKEYNGGIDIWMDPKSDNIAMVNAIKRDFGLQNTYCNIHHFEGGLAEALGSGPAVPGDPALTYTVLDTQTRALLYVAPSRSLLAYHRELLDIVVRNMAALLTKHISMKKLENAALIDPLTQCYNRRGLNGYIDHDIANAERYGSDLSVVMFDIDHFKAVNDTCGHKAGDAVLRAVARSVLATIRKSDYLSRYGGEEFLLVLPETKFSKAIELAERLRKIIENMKINLGDRVITVTASFGVAACKKGWGKAALFQKADEMLYEAKRQGRNRIKPDLRLFYPLSGMPVPVRAEEKSISH